MVGAACCYKHSAPTELKSRRLCGVLPLTLATLLSQQHLTDHYYAIGTEIHHRQFYRVRFRFAGARFGVSR